jgi:hypothetical protein
MASDFKSSKYSRLVSVSRDSHFIRYYVYNPPQLIGRFAYSNLRESKCINP